ncbi:MAG: hypothetical protein ACRD12_17005, partial [Acidimicrobiales bacterium]
AATIVVLDGAQGAPDRLMSALTATGVRRLDVLVASRPGSGEARMAETLLRRFPAGAVLAPARSRLQGATTPPAGSELRVGGLVLRIDEAGDRLGVSVRAAGARDPPG